MGRGAGERVFDDDDIVISGISGRFPESENIEEFSKNLFNGVDMLTADDRRWTPGLHGLPERNGKLKNLSSFDAQFFTVHAKQADAMDPQVRLILESTYETIIDAGFNPNELRGTKTGVYVASSLSESDDLLAADVDKITGYFLTGCARAMFANRISYTFDFTGPSIITDSACSGSSIAFAQAVDAIKSGQCDKAIVGGTNLCLTYCHDMLFHKMKLLSPEGRCAVFDADSNGYVRSESVVTVLLQKRSTARRVYATVRGAKANSDGYKEQGFMQPSGLMQRQLALKTYESATLNPEDVTYLEAHGLGLKESDQTEVNAMVDIFCKDRKSSLLIGSVKSNMGHAESASGLCSIAKVILAMEKGIIPGNLHFQAPNPEIPALIDGRLKVVDRNTPWEGGLVAVNSSGWGGTNVHIILESERSAPKEKANYALPRLVTASGRTEEAVNALLDHAANNAEDAELHALMDAVHAQNIPGHSYRGYRVLAENGPQDVINEDVSGEPRPIWFLFPGIGSQWSKMACDLMKIPLFSKSINKSAEILKPYGVDLLNIIAEAEDSVFDESVVNSYISISAVQIALVDVLRAVGIKPDGIIGHSHGEVGCAYADEVLTAEETILCAYWRGQSMCDFQLEQGAMAAVGLTWEECLKKCPEDIFPACHNSKDNVTVSGPVKSIVKFVDQLTSEGIFVRRVNSKYAYHSKYVAPVQSLMLANTEKVIKNPKLRTHRWLSTSVPIDLWDKQGKLCDASYILNNFLAPVRFAPCLDYIPENAILIEIAPHALFNGIVKKALPTCAHVPLVKKNNPNLDIQLLASIGKIYSYGAHPKISNIYPRIQFPVSRGTPGLSSHVSWDHSLEWLVADCNVRSGENIIEYDLSKNEDSFISGHNIDGRVLFPATGYLSLVWRTIAKLTNKKWEETPIVFEDVQFRRATIVPQNGPLKFLISIIESTGEFGITEGGSIVVTGFIRLVEDSQSEKLELPPMQSVPEKDLLPLLTEDIYKELRLRGYNYAGIFQGIESSDPRGTTGTLAWKNNWISFIDTMLQFCIIGTDTRELYLPTRLQRAYIDPIAHSKAVASCSENILPIEIHRDIDVISCGGIELRGLKTNLAPRRANAQAPPKLEKYVFIPYASSSKNSFHSKSDALIISLQLFLENVGVLRVNVGEIAYDRPVDNLLLPTALQILESEPQVRVTAHVAAGNAQGVYSGPMQNLGVKVINKEVTEKDCQLILSSNLLSRHGTALSNVTANLSELGMLLVEEPHDVLNDRSVRDALCNAGLVIVSCQLYADCQLILLRKKPVLPEKRIIIEITEDDTFDWVDKLREAMNEAISQDMRICLVSRNATSGVLGLGACLRSEAGGKALRIFFLPNSQENISLDAPSFADQVANDLNVNILKNGEWGSYRHILLGESSSAVLQVEHAYVNTLTRGDLSSLRWIQSDLHYVGEKPLPPRSDLCQVYYAPLNFRDIMLATGKLPPDALPGALAGKECILGLEFSGRSSEGKRVMGMVAAEGLATTVVADVGFLWEIPKGWSFEEAATVPVAYATAYYALSIRGRMRKGESVLIHAGTGGVGQAAISIALHTGCTVYTTVGTPEKRTFIRERFPQIPESNIGNSRDTSFEQLVLTQTNGRGVDLVLNSLAADKLQASVRCLAIGGRFLEIGKLDLSNNTGLGMSIFLKNTTFHGILLDALFECDDDEKSAVVKCVNEGIANGAVRPLPATVYSDKQLEQAFRFMATGKHIGKVLLKVRDEETSETGPQTKLISAIPRTYLHPNKSYILIGGLGGFGLELAQWLVVRGATKLVFNSRSGVRTGYQSWCIRRWREQGVEVVSSTNDSTTAAGAKALLKEANELGPVGGVFNLAAVLKDAFLENLIPDDFRAVARPKIDGTKALDIATRELAPELEQFVVFSSLACGRGNPGQSNYGFANSVMERIVEQRQADGLPGLAIQWGAIGEVGLIIDKMGGGDDAIGGTLPQRISSCMEAFGYMLDLPHPITASMVVAEKGRSAAAPSQDLVHAVANILGIKNPSKVSETANLAELGMDSLMGAEIKQTLERNYDVVLGVQEIRTLTFAKLKSLSGGDTGSVAVASEPESKNEKESTSVGELLPKQGIVKLASAEADGNAKAVFMIHAIEGFADVLRDVASHVKGTAYGLQCTAEAPLDDMANLAKHYLNQVRSLQPQPPYTLIGYSFGASVAFEMSLQLEQAGCETRLVLIDGSPLYVSAHTIGMQKYANRSSNADEADVLTHYAQKFKKVDAEKFSADLERLSSLEARVQQTAALLANDTPFSTEELAAAANSFCRKVGIGTYYKPAAKLTAPVTLFKATDNYVTLDEDYGLKQVCTGPVSINQLSGNHRTIVTGEAAQSIASHVNKLLTI